MNFYRIDSARINRLTERVFSLPSVSPPPAMTYAEKVIARRKLLRSGASFEKVDQIVPMSGYYSNQNTMKLSSLNLDYSLGGRGRFSPARLLSTSGWFDGFLGNLFGEDAAGALVEAGTTAATNAITGNSGNSGNSGNQSATGGGESVPAESEPFYKTGIGMAAIGGVALLGLVLVMKGKKRRR